jgi:hypothetical protein
MEELTIANGLFVVTECHRYERLMQGVPHSVLYLNHHKQAAILNSQDDKQHIDEH